MVTRSCCPKPGADTAGSTRYVGHGYWAAIPIEPQVLAWEDSKALIEAFAAQHWRRFDRTVAGVAAAAIYRVRLGSPLVVRHLRYMGLDGSLVTIEPSGSTRRQPVYSRDARRYRHACVSASSSPVGLDALGPGLVEIGGIDHRLRCFRIVAAR